MEIFLYVFFFLPSASATVANNKAFGKAIHRISSESQSISLASRCVDHEADFSVLRGKCSELNSYKRHAPSEHNLHV